MDVLHSKLQIPKRYQILHRERLIRHFKDICQKKLIAVTAGAGYGKTTLVMDALAALDIICVWYRLDEQDTDFSVFISYLYLAIQSHSPDSVNIEHRIPKSGVKKHRDTLIEWLAFVEKTVTQQTVLVLDDFHLVQDNQQINDAVEFILDRLPAHIHLVIIGRKNLSLRVSVLRANGQLIEISENDLSFSADEIKYFFPDALMLTNTHIKDIHLSTGGWAASLILLRYAFHKKTPESICRSLELFKQTPDYIFSYLKETIFDAQPDHIKTFMMKAALLPEIDTRQCGKIFDVDNAGPILKKMIKDHLMIFPVDDSGKIFYLHHLFRDFLIAQLEETFSKEDIQKLHCRIAHETEKQDIFQALHHYIYGHAFDDAMRIVETHEIKFVLEGKINFLSQCLKKIPTPIIEANPQLLLTKAKLFTYYGNPREAVKLLLRAHLMFKRQKSKENMVRCLVELGSQYYFTGYVKEAKLLMEQVLDDVEPSSTTYIIAMTFLTFLSSVLGEFETAAHYYKNVWEEIDTFPDFERKVSTALINTSYSYTLFIKGEFERSQKVNKKLLESAIDLNLEPCLPLAYYQISATSFYLGTFEKGIEFAQKGIDICEKISLSDSRRGWIYLAWAQNCLGLEQFDKAIEHIDNSILFYEDPGNRWGMANAWECLHQVYLAQGKFTPARQILYRAIDIIKGYGLPLTEGILENGKANLLMIEKKYSQALESLESARLKLKDTGFHLFNNHLLTSKSYFESGKASQAIQHLSSALALSERFTYDRFLKKEKKFLLSLLKTVLPKKEMLKGRLKAYVERVFKNDMANTPPELKISLLGQFKVAVGDNQIPLSRWKSAKALMILKYLAANRAQGFIPREALIEMLWPDEDLQKTGPRFNMAVSALRKTLEPNLSPKAASAYIERKKDRYQLFRDTRITIDTEQFSQMIGVAQKEIKNLPNALEQYLLAHSFYKGAFLEEDRYEEWCFQKREQFAMDYLKVLKAIVNIYERQNDLPQAISFTQKILAAEPFDENAFKNLMQFYAKSGKLSHIKKTYNRYEKMAQEMDFPVSADLKNLYTHLVQKT